MLADEVASCLPHRCDVQLLLARPAAVVLEDAQPVHRHGAHDAVHVCAPRRMMPRVHLRIHLFHLRHSHVSVYSCTHSASPQLLGVHRVQDEDDAMGNMDDNMGRLPRVRNVLARGEQCTHVSHAAEGVCPSDVMVHG